MASIIDSSNGFKPALEVPISHLLLMGILLASSKPPKVFVRVVLSLRLSMPFKPQCSAFSLTKVKKNDIMGLCIAIGVKGVNHAQFANDTILIGGASVQSARNFKK